jgi:hypothetical protein
MPKRSSKTIDPDHQQIARSVLDAVAPDVEPEAQSPEPPADEDEDAVAVDEEN